MDRRNGYICGSATAAGPDRTGSRPRQGSTPDPGRVTRGGAMWICLLRRACVNADRAPPSPRPLAMPTFLYQRSPCHRRGPRGGMVDVTHVRSTARCTVRHGVSSMKRPRCWDRCDGGRALSRMRRESESSSTCGFCFFRLPFGGKGPSAVFHSKARVARSGFGNRVRQVRDICARFSLLREAAAVGAIRRPFLPMVTDAYPSRYEGTVVFIQGNVLCKRT
ncbi:hypothetical protein MTO96_010530 [Rhipicephalus appendiculatus]